MSSNTQSRDERIDFRVNRESKSLFARAAEISGVSLTSFVIEAARERAMRLINEHDRLVLNNEARDVFMGALLNPPAPSTALRKAADQFLKK
jgi:uncharacterized protein (DUF1778 family)